MFGCFPGRIAWVSPPLKFLQKLTSMPCALLAALKADVGRVLLSPCQAMVLFCIVRELGVPDPVVPKHLVCTIVACNLFRITYAMFLQPECLGLLCSCFARITYAFFWPNIVFRITVWLVSSVHTCALRVTPTSSSSCAPYKAPPTNAMGQKIKLFFCALHSIFQHR